MACVGGGFLYLFSFCSHFGAGDRMEGVRGNVTDVDFIMLAIEGNNVKTGS